MDDLNIKYPIYWEYKVIGEDETKLRTTIKRILVNEDIKIEISKKSKNKKYISLNLKVLILSEENKISIFNNLKKEKAVKIIL